MRQLTTGQLTALRGHQEPPCISLYQPTHRNHPDSQQDPIRYRNLRRDMEASLLEKYHSQDVRGLLDRYQDLERDLQFWNHRTEGLAVLGSPEMFQVFELQRPVKELLVVANNFYTKPLLRIVQSADRYQILCLSRHEARLYEGNRDAIDPVDLIDVPATITEALGTELTRSRVAARSSPAGVSWYHGAGDKSDEVDSDRERFFRVIDRTILENHSRASGLPLILAALGEHHSIFHSISRNPFLLADGIQTNADALNADDLRSLAWKTMEPYYLERLSGLVDRYLFSKSRGTASDDLDIAAGAAVAGRVRVLLVEANRQIPGRIGADGLIEHGDFSDAETGDVINDLAEVVLWLRGEVVVVPAERMPSRTGVAATFRF